jgi:hypothetical protein
LGGCGSAVLAPGFADAGIGVLGAVLYRFIAGGTVKMRVSDIKTPA